MMMETRAQIRMKKRTQMRIKKRTQMRIKKRTQMRIKKKTQMRIKKRTQMRMKKRTQRKRYIRNISMPDYAPPHAHQNARPNTEELEQNENISCLTRLYACKDHSCTYMTCRVNSDGKHTHLTHLHLNTWAAAIVYAAIYAVLSPLMRSSRLQKKML
jgi:Flp pilus assembly protein TadB